MNLPWLQTWQIQKHLWYCNVTHPFHFGQKKTDTTEPKRLFLRLFSCSFFSVLIFFLNLNLLIRKICSMMVQPSLLYFRLLRKSYVTEVRSEEHTSELQ